MKTKQIWYPILLWLLVAVNANTFYDPDLQRWINRDPLGDNASLPATTAGSISNMENENLDERVVKPKLGSRSLPGAAYLNKWSGVNMNLYGGMGNDALNQVDPLYPTGEAPLVGYSRLLSPNVGVDTGSEQYCKKLAAKARQEGWFCPGVQSDGSMQVMFSLCPDCAKFATEELANTKWKALS